MLNQDLEDARTAAAAKAAAPRRSRPGAGRAFPDVRPRRAARGRAAALLPHSAFLATHHPSRRCRGRRVFRVVGQVEVAVSGQHIRLGPEASSGDGADQRQAAVGRRHRARLQHVPEADRRRLRRDPAPVSRHQDADRRAGGAARQR
jgi:hypothetical protein